MIRYFPGDDLFTPLTRAKGIPIGNLTSQFLANVYLNGFDHFVEEQLRPGGYIRFSDDFLLFGETAAELRQWEGPIREHLGELRLCLHGRKTEAMPVEHGFPFLGFRIYPDHRTVRRTTGVRFARRLTALARQYRQGEIDRDRVRACVMSWIGHLAHGDTWGLRRKLFFAAPLHTQRNSRLAA